MAKNIEEFLKMAAAKRQQGGAQQPPQPQQPPQRQQQQPRRPLDPEIIEIVDEVQVVDPLRSQSVGTHVSSHINTSEIAEHVTHLGEEVADASNKTEARIHQKFDQHVGHLGDDSIADIDEISAASTTAYDAQPKSAASHHLIEMFRAPQTMRNAILLKEILTRPDWD